jgi:PadR family transcriptional regulator PadR
MDSISRIALLQTLITGPGYGLELVDRVRARTGGKLILRNGSVYPALREMEREGLVTSYEADENVADRGGRPRRYYKLTARGAGEARTQRTTMLGLFVPANAEGL